MYLQRVIPIERTLYFSNHKVFKSSITSHPSFNHNFNISNPLSLMNCFHSYMDPLWEEEYTIQYEICWCKHNNNRNNTKKKLNNTLNIIKLKIRTQHYLDWGAALALFKEIQALGWLIFVTGADLLWLVSPRIQQPNKCCMARTASAQSVQAQSSTRRTPFFDPKFLKYLEILLNSLSHTILVAFNYLSSFTLDMKLVHSKAVYIVFQSFT